MLKRSKNKNQDLKELCPRSRSEKTRISNGSDALNTCESLEYIFFTLASRYISLSRESLYPYTLYRIGIVKSFMYRLIYLDAKVKKIYSRFSQVIKASEPLLMRVFSLLDRGHSSFKSWFLFLFLLNNLQYL